jgi:hypothetical protein
MKRRRGTTLLTAEQEKEIQEKCWEKGRLNYKLRKTQRKIKDAWIQSRKKFRKFYIESTRRLGKSSLLLMLFTEECISSPNRKCGFFAPVKDGLLDYIEPLIQRTFEDCPERLRPVFDKQRFMLKFPNGSVIIFRGSNNQQHRVRRGQEFHRAGIDEARDVDDLTNLIESVVFPSLFSTDGYMIISSTPADTRSHPLFTYRTEAKVNGWLVEIPIWEASKLDPEVYPLTLIEEWKAETIKAPDGQDIWEREYECKWVINRRKMAVPEWDSGTMVATSNRDPYYQFYHHYVGIDWGYKDFTAIVFATYNFRKARLEVDGELTYQGKDVRSDLIADRMNLEHSHLWGADAKLWRQVSDSADPILINELNKFKGMSFVPVQKAHTLEAMLNEFRVMVAGGKIVVSPKCQMLIHDLETAVWTDDRKKLDQDVFSHHFDHLMALVYLTRVLDVNVNPIPRDFMIDNVRVIDLNFDKPKAHGQSAQSLEAVFGVKR